MPIAARPGDILAVWSSDSLTGTLIRIGAVLRNRPGIANHVAIITHQDAKGRWIGIEGRPGGVGAVDCTRWLTDPRTRSNTAQPRPDDNGQTTRFLASCTRSLGLAYDWAGIAEDTAIACGAADLAAAIDHLWRWPAKDGQLPGGVVCSSLAAMLCAQVGWKHPAGADRTLTPADWWAWNNDAGWSRP